MQRFGTHCWHPHGSERRSASGNHQSGLEVSSSPRSSRTYLTPSADRSGKPRLRRRDHGFYPSFGSLIDFKLMYSSYSNKPCDQISLSMSLSPPTQYAHRTWLTIELGVLSMESEFRQQKENIFPDKGTVACEKEKSVISTSSSSGRSTFGRVLYVPRRPSPFTPRAKLSTQLTFCCASLTAAGWPSCSTLCMVMSALNVCISSARIGCLQALGQLR